MIATTLRLLLALMIATGASALAHAQPTPSATPASPPEAGAPAPAGDAQAPAPQAAAPATPDAAPPAADTDGVRRLKAGNAEFAVRVKPITGGPARGALVLVPGDGAYPFASRSVASLHDLMPAFGWTVWLPELESPPRVHVLAVEPAAGGAKEAPSIEAAQASELAGWSARNRQRLAATVAAAAGEGRVVLVAEGAGASLLTGLAGDAPNGAFAMALLYPVEMAGLGADWPKNAATPILEVFDPATMPEQGGTRRERANAAGLHYYRQAMVPRSDEEDRRSETLLVRRLRGWLSTLAREGDR